MREQKTVPPTFSFTPAEAIAASPPLTAPNLRRHAFLGAASAAPPSSPPQLRPLHAFLVAACVTVASTPAHAFAAAPPLTVPNPRRHAFLGAASVTPLSSPPRFRSRHAFLGAACVARRRASVAPLSSPRFRPRRRPQVSMHGSAWEGGCCGHDNGQDNGHDHEHNHGHEQGHDRPHSDSPSDQQSPSPPPKPSPLAPLIALRTRPPIALLALVLLLASLTPIPSAMKIASLSTCLILTFLPALAETASRFLSSGGRSVDIDALMTLAAGAAVLSGAALEGALLTTLYAVSHAVEHAVTARARRDLDNLRDMSPSTALLVPHPSQPSSAPVLTPVSSLRVSDCVLVRAGEILPCDGTVVSGDAFVALAHLTGESKPVPVSSTGAASVPAGARVIDAALTVQITATGSESTMARISRLVVSAQKNKPRLTRFFDKWTRLYSRVIIAMSLAIALLLPLGGGVRYRGAGGSIKRALGFLVASSPCALVIGAPVAYLSSLSACARRGVLVKAGPRALDATAGAREIVLDKTGTLTTGELVFVDALKVEGGRVRTIMGEEESRVIELAAALERGAVHPIAEAITRRAGGEGAVLEGVKTVPGRGVEAVEGGRADIRLGRMSFVAPDRPELNDMLESVSDGGAMVVTTMSDGGEITLLRFRDKIRAEAQSAVKLLRKQKLRVTVLTGDSEGTARLVDRDVGGVDEVIANATPESKLAHIRALHAKTLSAKSDSSELINGGVVMVGDGVNDAPALAAATVGISCGLTSATAVQAADVVLVRPDLRDLAWYVRKANTTRTIVKQNLVLALVLMLLAVVPSLAGAIPLWFAVLLHEGGTVVVGLNGLRLLSDKLTF